MTTDMVQTITDEQRQTLTNTTLQDGRNAWDYVLQQSEADQYLVAAGILSCIKKGRIPNRLTIFWEIEDLRNPPKKYEREKRQYTPSKELMENLTEGQKQQIQGMTITNGINAWDYVLSWPDDGQYWIASGILSCVEHGYGLTELEICWEARDLRYATISEKRDL